MKSNALTALAICTGGILLSSCGSSSKPADAPKAPPPVPVAIYTVEQGSAEYYDEYPATVVALNEVQLRPQVAGYITGVFVKDGQHVSKGQKLYSIDQQQYQASYNQAVANLNVAKANLGKAQQDADRYAELQKNDAIARQTVEHAQADLQASKMQLEAAKANVSSVQTNVRYSTIYAPFEGTIGISQVKLGAAVSPGQTILNTLSSDNPIAVDVAVDQKEITRFLALQQKPNAEKDSTFRLSLPDQSIYPYPGSIAFIDRAVDPQTGTIKARVVFPNKDKMLKAGMSCNIRVRNNGNAQSLLIPAKAVLEQMGEYFVYVVGDSNKVVQHKIVTGQVINDKIIVKSGLQQNDKIVTEGIQKLRDGVKVQPATDSSAARPK
ncbi:MAG TPA: efflux RND transporter periplasmic adaptor subunit [Chitinophagaceae bacterium]|nr:efflux RND transporter periplasmic adaptor subunit [Chitinophagaceae bacterium]